MNRLRWAGWAVAVVWAWFASGVRTFTRPAEVLTFIPVFAVLVLTVVRPRERRPASKEGAGRLPGALAWIATAVAVLGWELTELFSKPRHTHPTLSSIINTLLSTHPSRFAGYLCWLILGWLMVRDLTRRRDPKSGHRA